VPLWQGTFRVMSDLGVGTGPAGTAQASLDGAQSALKHAKEFLEDGEAPAAREILEKALAAGERHPDLLWLLADAGFADGDIVTGRNRLAEAVLASGQDAVAVARQVEVLSRNGLWREALLTAESIPADLRADPSVRAEVGNFYRQCGCCALAAESYGRPGGLRRRARAARCWCWLRSGGPSERIRRRAKAWEESNLLKKLRRGVRFADQLDHIPDLEGRVVLQLRIQTETLLYRLRRLSTMWHAVFRAIYRARLAAGLIVWLIIFALVRQVKFVSGPGGISTGTVISAATATALVFALSVALIGRDMQPRVRVRIPTGVPFGLFALAVAFETAAAAGYADRVMPTVGWWAWVVLGLVAVPAILACAILAEGIMLAAWWIQYRQIMRADCLVAVAGMLLNVLDDLRASAEGRPFAQILADARTVESAARLLQRHLLPGYLAAYLGSGEWLARRTTGWAEALRHVQRQIIAPVPGMRDKAATTLAHEIRCLATRDLGALAWREPPPRLPRRVVLRRTALTALRTVLVAALPLAAVLAAQPLIHASPGVFGWTRIATATWALLYLVLSLDPAIRDKIDTTSQIVGLLHDTRPGP
jgi:hypothetical protein